MTVNLYKYEQIFKQMDSEELGYLKIDQLYHAVNKQLKIDMDMKTLEVMMALVDDNNDGVMQEDEFCHFLYICQNADFNDTKSILFYAADDDYSGSIDKFEMLKIIDKLHLDIKQELIFSMVSKQADNDDGSLSYSMFITIMNQMMAICKKEEQIEIVERTPNVSQNMIAQKSNPAKESTKILRLKNASVSFI
ncbi:EF_hand domain-containing protein [Hexamita inflata]|uniref:EF hand domain-containing protein n=1 Tax=Hexamita inflata TaxID=28002 RepID=A0AA86P2W1_9EUKA|nr:EF hand domain-containing protein [Hexamita inflata]